jgi:hypothetical protein
MPTTKSVRLVIILFVCASFATSNLMQQQHNTIDISGLVALILGPYAWCRLNALRKWCNPQ